MRITFGEGKVHTQQGVTSDGFKCVSLRVMEQAQQIGATPRDWKKEFPESESDCVLVFKNIEGARTLQDELNELIAVWAKEQGPVVETFEAV